MYGVGNVKRFYSIKKLTGAASTIGPGTTQNGRGLAAPPLKLPAIAIPMLSALGMAIFFLSTITLGAWSLGRRVSYGLGRGSERRRVR